MAAWVPWAFAEPPSTGGRYPAGRASKASNCEDGLNQTLTRCVAQCLPGRPYSPRVVTAPFSPTRALVHFAMPVRLYICIAPWRMTTRFLTAEAGEDFSVACQLMPEYGDAWKRRGQARSALGENEGALEVCFAVGCPQVCTCMLCISCGLCPVGRCRGPAMYSAWVSQMAPRSLQASLECCAFSVL